MTTAKTCGNDRSHMSVLSDLAVVSNLSSLATRHRANRKPWRSEDNGQSSRHNHRGAVVEGEQHTSASMPQEERDILTKVEQNIFRLFFTCRFCSFVIFN
ncbi:unnamed protein product, partial [Dicrocoelium dendriticum]